MISNSRPRKWTDYFTKTEKGKQCIKAPIVKGEYLMDRKLF